ncbi:uncharacterized protein LOC132036638 [Lycium ferocissimum]|uniref:uncharacterized protein LOC132036638 n=1 Tax=Lycium ferocissimum TaxID=112874 RepID=UPI0028169865|nr:uncharacterized protein LOC132036638 [Lycium ferocissimum]
MAKTVFQLLSLTFQSASKLIADGIKNSAGSHPTFRSGIILLAEKHNNLIANMQKMLIDESKIDIKFEKLDEEKAISVASSLLAESFIIWAGLTLWWLQTTYASKDVMEKLTVLKEGLLEDLDGMEERVETLEHDVFKTYAQLKVTQMLNGIPFEKKGNQQLLALKRIKEEKLKLGAPTQMLNGIPFEKKVNQQLLALKRIKEGNVEAWCTNGDSLL